ncbi:hypothetical protein HDU99_009340, partial [Rhizoclosmatium hyalinum]
DVVVLDGDADLIEAVEIANRCGWGRLVVFSETQRGMHEDKTWGKSTVATTEKDKSVSKKKSGDIGTRMVTVKEVEQMEAMVAPAIVGAGIAVVHCLLPTRNGRYQHRRFLVSQLRFKTKNLCSPFFSVPAYPGIVAAKRGTPQIEVTFAIDANSILTVSAEDKGTGKKEDITISNANGRLTESEVERMVLEAEQMALDDQSAFENIEARYEFENYLYLLEAQVSSQS